MTSENDSLMNAKALQSLEEICDNTRAIRRVVNRILDHLHESQDQDEESDYDLDAFDWEDLNGNDDMYS
jgi:hypothetical protein